MRCHYTYDEEAGKVLIPGCMGTAALGIDNCTCSNSVNSFEAFEKREYRNKLQEKECEIKELTEEVVRLNRIIKKLISNGRSTAKNKKAIPKGRSNKSASSKVICLGV